MASKIKSFNSLNLSEFQVGAIIFMPTVKTLIFA